MKKQTNQTGKKRKRTIAIVAVVLVTILLVGGIIYSSTPVESPDVAQGRIKKEETKSEPTTTGSSSPDSTVAPSLAPQSPATPTATQSNSLPTPVLAKSSGNNGSIPSGVLVNFTCTSTPGYYCQVQLERSGSSPIILEKKQLIESRGTAATSWNWESIRGTWNVTAILSNSSGDTKSSASQALEVGQ